MKIEYNQSDNRVRFSELAAGETFLYSGDHLCLKLRDKQDNGVSAVRLADGAALCFENTDTVERADCKVVASVAAQLYPERQDKVSDGASSKNAASCDVCSANKPCKKHECSVMSCYCVHYCCDDCYPEAPCKQCGCTETSCFCSF